MHLVRLPLKAFEPEGSPMARKRAGRSKGTVKSATQAEIRAALAHLRKALEMDLARVAQVVENAESRIAAAYGILTERRPRARRRR
jgi:hypothetical protein